jgi:RHS repeat-associated protein
LERVDVMRAVPQAYDGVEEDRRTSSGSTQMAYGFAGLSHQATLLSGQSSGHGEWFVRDPEGMVLAMVETTSPTAPAVAGYYLVDDQDSVMAVTPAATTAIRYLYEPYGETIRTWTDPSPGTSSSKYTEDGSATTPTVDHNPGRYVSGYHDKATGFLKFGTRYYMPTVGTWTQPDPATGQVQKPLTLNRYLYANSNPVNTVDPTGRYSETDGDVIGSLVLVAGELLLAGTLTAAGIATAPVTLTFAAVSVITIVGIAYFDE